MDSPPKKTEATREADLFPQEDECGETSVRKAMEWLSAEVLATVSHELRSPLTTIKGYTTTLLLHEERITSQERHEFLLTIKEACERLEKMIARMLELAQLESGEVMLQLSPVNLPHLIRETLIAGASCPGQHQGEGNTDQRREHSVLTLHLEDSSGLPTQEEPVIQADRRLLENMLFLLLENAWRHSPEGASIEVVIRPVVGTDQESQSHLLPDAGGKTNPHREAGVLTVPAESQPMLEICVQDQGSGIAPEYLEHIFERFQRANMQLMRDGGGLGLGLAICRYIVALHQGKIWAESAVGEGSIFHIQLPLDGPAP